MTLRAERQHHRFINTVESSYFKECRIINPVTENEGMEMEASTFIFQSPLVESAHFVIAALEIREEEDVYDVVDESEYQSLVESRRQREDFVVDDGMCRKRLPFSCSFDCNLHRTARQW